MEEEKKNYYKLKFIIIGEQGAGKTSIVSRFVNGGFINEYQMTIGVDYLSCDLELDEKLYSLRLWDTAGSERFRSVNQSYYRNAICALIVYDITDQKSFDSISKWIEDCNEYTNENIIKILVGNKTDLEDQRKISQQIGREKANNNMMLFFECSALNGYNIENIFYEACNTKSKNIDEGKYDSEDFEVLGLEKCEADKDFRISKRLSRPSVSSDIIREEKKKCC